MTVSSITALSTSSKWGENVTAWVDVARAAGHEAGVVEGEWTNSNCPVVLVDGNHYVLTRQSDPQGILVLVDYRAVKTDRGWVPADSSPSPVIRRTYRL